MPWWAHLAGLVVVVLLIVAGGRWINRPSRRPADWAQDRRGRRRRRPWSPLLLFRVCSVCRYPGRLLEDEDLADLAGRRPLPIHRCDKCRALDPSGRRGVSVRP